LRGPTNRDRLWQAWKCMLVLLDGPYPALRDARESPACGVRTGPRSCAASPPLSEGTPCPAPSISSLWAADCTCRRVEDGSTMRLLILPKRVVQEVELEHQNPSCRGSTSTLLRIVTEDKSCENRPRFNEHRKLIQQPILRFTRFDSLRGMHLVPSFG